MVGQVAFVAAGPVEAEAVAEDRHTASAAVAAAAWGRPAVVASADIADFAANLRWHGCPNRNEVACEGVLHLDAKPQRA